MSKKVAFSKKTVQAAPPAKPTADAWVTGQTGPMKRLTLDIPLALHGRIKSQCATKGLTMADEIRQLLEERFR